MHLQVTAVNNVDPAPLSMRCSTCKQMGIFNTIAGSTDVNFSGELIASMKICPNEPCKALVFVVYNFRTRYLALSYPAEKLDFDTTNIPIAVAQALEEAITCHANQAYTAAAIMVRKTLEELCHNQQAEGKTLQQRLEALQTKIILPKGLIEAAHDLRLLGNDAAHIEAKTFNQVSKEEVEVGILLAKELLKAIFQYENLLGMLQGLKKSKDKNP